MAETMLDCLSVDVFYVRVDPLVTPANIIHLPSIHVDKLKYGYTDALGYNKCKVGTTLGGALMARCMKGENKVCL